MEQPGLWPLISAALAFLVSHLALSHPPLRTPLVRRLGRRGFPAAYSLVALAALGWMIAAFRRAPTWPQLWDGSAGLPWALASGLTLVALALLIGSLAGNPAFPAADTAGLADRVPQGAFRITRHPMMWGIALWALAHALVAPSARGLALTGTIATLALLGAHLQDRRKLGEAGAAWAAWLRHTQFFPQPAQLGAPGWRWAAAGVLWLALTFAHMPLAGIPAGLWRWL